jgi:hypothetical protein
MVVITQDGFSHVKLNPYNLTEHFIQQEDTSFVKNAKRVYQLRPYSHLQNKSQ